MIQRVLKLLFVMYLGLSSSKKLGESHVEFIDKIQAEAVKSSPEYHIVYPYVVDNMGNFISHHIHHRSRRSLDTSDIHYHIPYKNKRLHLQLKPNADLMVSGFEIEWASGRRSLVNRNCHFVGSVRNYSESSVAVSNCGGLSGLIRAGHEGEFFIEPVMGVNPSHVDGKHAHVIYRRSIDEGLKTNHSEPACGASVKDTQDFVHVEKEDSSEKKGFSVRRRSRRSVSLMKHVELLVVADYSMTKYYSDRDLESYLFTVMNMLSMVFKHRSVGSAIHVVLVRMIILDREDKNGFNVTNHATKTLFEFCRWVQKNNPSSDMDPNHADAAVLITRKDICRDSYRPCETLGITKIDGMCSSGDECSYIEDTGYTLAYTIAHELGHNLGVLHDDDYSGCSRLREHIMASNLVINPKKKLWSKCSKKALRSFFYKGWGWCLNDRPFTDLQPDLYRQILPGEIFDADAQCKMLFGSKSTICSGSETELCSTLWCVHDGGCATKHFNGNSRGSPALDGTPCGKTKFQWCLNSKCVDRGILKERVDGNWGGWLRWSKCSRSCGLGVRRRIRKCNDPRPKNGGTYCVGEWEQHSTCNLQDCPEGVVNPVEIQCQKFRSFVVHGRTYEWTARQDEKNPCELRCTPVVGDGVVMIRKFIQGVDGTPCNHGTRNICVQGKCEHVGCDNVLYSNAREDKCGVCRGDGSSCETKHVLYEKPLGGGYTEVAVIPAGSRNIIIQERRGSSNFIALRSPSGDYYFNGNYIIQWSREYDVAGVTGEYIRKHNKDTFKTKGPIKEDVHVMVLKTYGVKNPGIKVQYDVVRNGTFKPKKFRWKFGRWSPCPVSCGSGIRTRDKLCVDEQDNAVDDRLCRHLIRFVKKRCRRKECPPSWWIGAWHECSTTCGEGVKIRPVICTRVIRNIQRIIDDSFCRKEKPSATGVCRQPLCWVVQPWSNCSSMCGPGRQYRAVECPGNESRCDVLTKPINNRTCFGEACSRWRVGPWGECSASCGNGSQSRNVSCDDRDESLCLPEEKPKSLQSCSSFMCPVWKTGDWSNCSVICGKGVQSRIVTCEVSHENFTCDETQKPSVEKICFEKCSGWTVGKWTACSASCGKGVRMRNVSCTFKFCSNSTRPKTEENCTMEKCPQWLRSKWSECSVSCGKGFQSRNVTCSDPVHSCDEKTRPFGVQPCNRSQCSKWTVGNWSKCSVSCGIGVQTRNISCNASASEECALSAPKSVKPCYYRPCNIWETGNWTECSETCGRGIQRRSVWCLSDSCDNAQKPNATRPCNNANCMVWVTGNWGPCSGSCGEGVQKRQVYCSDDDNSQCDVLEMPESTRDCFVSRCGSWIVSRWGPCNATCGHGFSKRNASCVHSDIRKCSGKPTVETPCKETPCGQWSSLQWGPCSVTCGRGQQRRIVSCDGGQCLASKKPLSFKECIMPSCGQWVIGNWSSCSVTCGEGVQKRDVRCSDEGENNCTKPKPIVERFCQKQKCSDWLAGNWSQCSTTCGNGTQTRNVSCAGIGCSNVSKPVTYQSCYSGRCPQWIVKYWIPCTRSCGGGVQVRLVYCQSNSGSSCKHLKKPGYRRTCNNFPCPHWVVGNWTDCSRTCEGGIQNRVVSCNNSHVGNCLEKIKPISSRPCGNVLCPQWTVSEWSACSSSCNGGFKTRWVSCKNNEIGECSSEKKPASTLRCGELPCPEWTATKWSRCSKSCNGGVRYRDVVCNNSQVGDCPLEHKPPAHQKCGILPCPQWKVSKWGKCSKSCGGGQKARIVLCANSHVGKCVKENKPRTVRKCRQVACPFWYVGEWTRCSKTCGDGFQTRNVSCRNDRIGRCSSTNKPSSLQKCVNLPCAYWSTGSWSECSKSCNGGTQIREVICNNHDDGECEKSTKPVSNRTCGDVPCPYWSTESWSKCSKTCNGGVQFRKVKCVNMSGECRLDTKPTTNQTCSNMPCPVWSTGNWSYCSKSCGGGIQTRNVTCQNKHVGKCPDNLKPIVVQDCGLKPCPVWSLGNWTKCSKSCGGGFQTRSVHCVYNEFGDCSIDEKPNSSRSCAVAPCSKWSAGDWSDCSKSCGGGLKVRNISCENKEFGGCLVSDKPQTTSDCNNKPCPEWSAGQWSKCSKSCNGGIKIRNVTCVNSKFGNCSVADKPITSQECSYLPCPEWSTGEWSECSKSCDGGIQRRTVICKNSLVGKCLDVLKPSFSRACGEMPCPKWSVGNWSECSKSCGSGERTRTVKCSGSSNLQCEEKKPVNRENCNNIDCPVWIVGNWSECSKSCGSGERTRTVKCSGSSSQQCKEKKPVNREDCNNIDCPVWIVGNWSECSKSCGSGERTRTVKCSGSSSLQCKEMKPVNREDCNNIDCPIWIVGNWSECSKSCGSGERTRTVKCSGSSSLQCKEKKPVNREDCNKIDCPVWIVGNWSECSKSCGSGERTRTVKCSGSSSLQCKEKKPVNREDCNNIDCPVWIVGNWSECSKSCGSGERTRTVKCSGSSSLQCKEKKPVNREDCNNIDCPVWIVGNWSECSKSCGSGERTRTVKCSGSSSQQCKEKKPVNREDCNNIDCPVWIVGNWSECSKSCGSGERTRTVKCSGSSSLQCKEKKPVNREDCNNIDCPVWIVGNWSECSKSCGSGERTRTVKCSGSSSLQCKEMKPVNREDCNNIDCPIWIVGNWSECSKSCGSGENSYS
ncbi:A disintegrin and metalloproteinase with thrombospondin motifs 9-like isoform X2 [Xenia sp. Carnegie-2017]|uniref:A disintegrin and metalloproteinase with thrombospondin motifs 9-like isoform X2 n=1 Tax=Xenia sp. Carnegie-2017 TaxID=2897299 RepID=UPI001F04A35B|nr:A disintegrin and metalloproteinase with thrombospondin motifs 9-like isoform X2 [Xenia sp. Carnegie-2017]